MSRRPALSEMLWPDDPADADLPVQWAEGISILVLDWLWRGYDQLRDKHLSRVDMTQSIEQLERNLTFLHFGEILEIWARDTEGFCSLRPGHEIPEFENRISPSAKPPAYDLGFVHAENQRWIWPIEAKVLSTSAALAEYMNDVRGKFVAGIAGPFVGEGGMIGYLVHGLPSDVFDKLTRELGQQLLLVSEFNARQHRSSHHVRTDAPSLRLHHMIMELANPSASN
ncbi:MAG TPA: hypothetical protein VN048_13635 [Verrucomicrobiae bacterium]|jgi:hypothetical protein|nr:hypothetical protein [Verrucomicrobiae bacterium]